MDPERVETALQLLGEEDGFFSFLALMARGFVLYSEGALVEAQRTFRKTSFSARERGSFSIAACALHDAVFVLLDLGRRREAEQVCLRETGIIEESFDKLPPTAGIVYIALAAVYYTKRDLTRAEEFAWKALEYCGRFDMDYLLLESSERILAAVRMAVAGENDALSMISRYRERQTAFPVRFIHDKMVVLEIEIAIRQGNLDFAENFFKSPRLSFGHEADPLNLDKRIVHAKWLAAQNEWDDAGRMLKDIAELAKKYGYCAKLIKVRIIQSRVQQVQGNMDGALEELKEAVGLAEKEEFISPFFEEGRDLVPLLNRLRSLSPRFIDGILDTSLLLNDGVTHGKLKHSQSDAFEALSRRELDVLKCIADGFSNAEIAEKLFISLGTVKWHVNNIFGKLHVKSRTRAVVLARERDLV